MNISTFILSCLAQGRGSKAEGFILSIAEGFILSLAEGFVSPPTRNPEHLPGDLFLKTNLTFKLKLIPPDLFQIKAP